MQNWFSKNLGDPMLAFDAIEYLERRFSENYANTANPKDLAVFIRHESEGRLHCEVIVYFSPAAVDIAQKQNAKPCQTPSPNGLSLLAGAEEACQTLFPNHQL